MAMVAWLIICKVVHYLIIMQYAFVATDQFTNDSAYAVLKTQHTINSTTTIIGIAGFCLLLWLIIRVWTKKPIPK